MHSDAIQEFRQLFCPFSNTNDLYDESTCQTSAENTRLKPELPIEQYLVAIRSEKQEPERRFDQLTSEGIQRWDTFVGSQSIYAGSDLDPFLTLNTVLVFLLLRLDSLHFP